MFISRCNVVALIIEAQGMTHTLHGDCNILSFHPFFFKTKKITFSIQNENKKYSVHVSTCTFPLSVWLEGTHSCWFGDNFFSDQMKVGISPPSHMTSSKVKTLWISMYWFLFQLASPRLFPASKPLQLIEFTEHHQDQC